MGSKYKFIFKEKMCLYIKIYMSKKLEDLTLEEIKAQMSIYQTLYYKKKKQEDPEFAAKIRERDRQRYYKKRDELGKPSMKDVRKYNHLGLIAVSAE